MKALPTLLDISTQPTLLLTFRELEGVCATGFEILAGAGGVCTCDCVIGDSVAGDSEFKLSNETLLRGHATYDFKQSPRVECFSVGLQRKV